ncbi:translation initiation/elongation factor MRX8 ASCRUDRAFT_75301 [Ascoidea rubescens DSM 1968]|uniref:EngB-type G domain-containing protein n=1 Tax=Ascoidea rubescens DSM 1968 TaxID=1344418 RepID=A0A1D2VKG0_9ASCO|nr:hypothetical protein ASCRUDRAFT_75301 [Ascoidea rubescens DSM 1968]ODV62094.1 hypothetical protein ASCRUDRAFT_75301 [Ascoidea rubescens DSM 1968]
MLAFSRRTASRCFTSCAASASPAPHTAHAKQHLPGLQLTADLLNQQYKQQLQFLLDSKKSESATNVFFNKTKITLEWSVVDYRKIPGEAHADEPDGSRPDPGLELQSTNSLSVKQRVNLLPEVLFMGKYNSGKSTLLNALITPSQNKKLDEICYVSKTAGFTKTLRCFNLNKKFKIIDSPGYGTKALPSQGQLILKYIQNRSQLRKVLLLVSTPIGIKNDDLSIIDILYENNIYFDIIFTKIDKVSHMSQIQATVDTLNSFLADNEYHIKPHLYFCCALSRKKDVPRQGIADLRYNLLQSCEVPLFAPKKRS